METTYRFEPTRVAVQLPCAEWTPNDFFEHRPDASAGVRNSSTMWESIAEFPQEDGSTIEVGYAYNGKIKVMFPDGEIMIPLGAIIDAARAARSKAMPIPLTFTEVAPA